MILRWFPGVDSLTHHLVRRWLVLGMSLCVLSVGGTSAAAAAGELVTITLVGGARLTATLLRQNNDGIALDLGHDVITIPAQRVLDIRTPEKHSGLEKQEHAFFRVGQLEVAPVPELVKRFGDAVVVVRTPSGLGSGFIISDQGHLITNYHVIERSTKVSVTLFQRGPEGYQKQQFKRVKVLATHPLRDLALMQIDVPEFEKARIHPVVIAEKTNVQVGDIVFTIGNPLGLERSVTQGIVSSTTRTLGHLRFFQTDASINSGNSGGPMFNSRGEVVGVVCAGFMFFDGLAFGIPASDLIDFLKNREAYLFDPTKPQNGVTYLPPPYRSKKAKNIDQDKVAE